MDKLFIPKYCDAGSIILINHNGSLRKLFCPFRVRSIAAVGALRPNLQFWVDAVATNSKDELIYCIQGKPYLYAHFAIIASF